MVNIHIHWMIYYTFYSMLAADLVKRGSSMVVFVTQIAFDVKHVKLCILDLLKGDSIFSSCGTHNCKKFEV
jgi:hypothetical protein